MKSRHITIFTTLIAFIFLSSCQKNHTKDFIGNYTFKTSGTFDIVTNENSTSFDKNSEIGQLEIIDIGDFNKVKVVKNILGGKIVVYNATCSLDEIYFDPIVTKNTIKQGELEGTLHITSIANGKLYYDKQEKCNKILITEDYSGYWISSLGTQDLRGEIKNSEIYTIAVLNKD